MSYRCAHENCDENPTFGVQGTKLGVFCAQHCRAGFVEVVKHAQDKRTESVEESKAPAGPSSKATITRCANEMCSKRPSYGVVGSTLAEYCARHAPSGMTNVLLRRCAVDGCDSRPTYGQRGSKVPILCDFHVKDGMVLLVGKRCRYQGCDEVGNYREKGSKINAAYFCKAHAQKEMVKVEERKSCLQEGCHREPHYAMGGRGPGIYCSQHAPEGMSCIRKSRRCHEEDCQRFPSFGVEGTTAAMFCSQHAKEGMVNVKNKTCAEESCRTQPSYGVKGTKRKEYCSRHAKEGMVNLINMLCADENCRKPPTHGAEGSKKAIYCAQHARDGMVGVKEKRCLQQGCDKFSIYGLESDRRRIYCADHARPGMVNMRSSSKLCKNVQCSMQPSHGVPGSRFAVYCAAHAAEGMVKIRNKRCTQHACRRLPVYGMPGTTLALYCSQHLKPGMVNLSMMSSSRIGIDIDSRGEGGGNKVRIADDGTPEQQQERNQARVSLERGGRTALGTVENAVTANTVGQKRSVDAHNGDKGLEVSKRTCATTDGQSKEVSRVERGGRTALGTLHTAVTSNTEALAPSLDVRTADGPPAVSKPVCAATENRESSNVAANADEPPSGTTDGEIIDTGIDVSDPVCATAAPPMDQ